MKLFRHAKLTLVLSFPVALFICSLLIQPNDTRQSPVKTDTNQHGIPNKLQSLSTVNFEHFSQQEYPALNYIEDANYEPAEFESYENLDQLTLQEILEKAASDNAPVSLLLIGKLKTYYTEADNLDGYQILLESLPDSFEMKSELLCDLVFVYQEREQPEKALKLINSINWSEDDSRIHQYKAELYSKLNNPALAIESLLTASQLSENHYVYSQISKLFGDIGDSESSEQFQIQADELKKQLDH